ncbi:sensor histidine kinase [Chitinophaga sancti]|uniref:histidine kinase n=1 Tax=Chitinophaga sancti TaxID=1004 RepID=A0A1K1MJY1_9BACT|nr:ATP-binding protein [Chitinophaga sancti]WQD62749.1 ATP-binding protein [Chitinophaga sancti]WQG91627.1 ATP-binding protein [Chitinophaga sancti]SFW23381.1 Signal transduction histidine kinase [Chitinophaga sancti]
MNDAIINKALASFVPALLLDLNGNLLSANDRARGLVQLPGGDPGKAHYDHLIGERTGIYWGALLASFQNGLKACVEFAGPGGQWTVWQLLSQDEYFVLLGQETARPDKLFNHLPLGIQQFSVDGFPLKSNALQKEIWGPHHPIFIQPGYNILRDPVYRQIGLSQMFEEVLDKGRPVKKEILLRYQEYSVGDAIRLSPCFYEATVFPAFNPQRQISDLFLLLKECTAQKLHLMGLEKSARLLESVVEHLPIGYVQFDHHGFLRRINQTHREFLKVRPGFNEDSYNILSDPFARMYGFNEMFMTVVTENKMMRKEIEVDFGQETHFTALSLVRWMDYTLFPLQDPVDKKTIVVALINDITDTKLEHYMRTELQRNTEQLHLFFDAVDMGYATLERDGRVNFMNRKAAQMAGVEIQPGCNIFDIIPEFRTPSPFLDRLAQAMNSTVSKSFSSYFYGMDKWYDFLVTPMRDNTVSVFIRDITGSRKLQKELRRANSQLSKLNRNLLNQNQQLEDFAHITSHNLRAPIANLKALMQLHNHSEEEKEKTEYLGMLESVINKTDETLNDLVNVVQIRKETDIRQEQLLIEGRLQYVSHVLLLEINKSGLQITTDLQEAPSIRFPRIYLDSILQNLITNAIRYRMPERVPTLHFSSWKEKGLITLTAEDNGMGIDMNRFGSKLFGFRKTFHKNSDAKGIGLFITKTQVEAMGGSISAESVPGRGTKFIITFKTE